MIGMMTALVYLVYIMSLVVHRLSPSASLRFWTSETINACVTASAMLYIMSHALVLFERHLAGSRPMLHGQLVTRTTTVLGVIALWIYSTLVASIPILRCLVNRRRGLQEQDVAGFRHGYVVYLAIQFIFAAVASTLLMMSVVDRMWRGRHAASNSFDHSGQFQTASAFDKDQTRRCIVAVVVCVACWTPCVTFQLADQLGCRLITDDLDRQAIIGAVSRQVSPLVGLTASLLMPLIYSCRCRCPPGPGCRNTATLNIS